MQTNSISSANNRRNTWNTVWEFLSLITGRIKLQSDIQHKEEFDGVCLLDFIRLILPEKTSLASQSYLTHVITFLAVHTFVGNCFQE